MFDPDIIGKKVMAKKSSVIHDYGGRKVIEFEVPGEIVGFSPFGTTHEKVGLFSSEKITTGFSFAVKSTGSYDYGEVFETSSVRFLDEE